MIKIFIPINKGKTKSNIRGFWRSPSSKVYYDYLNIQTYNKNYILQKLEFLKEAYNQESIFYIDNRKAFIFNNKKDITELSQRQEIIIEKDKKVLKKAVIKFLKIYGGVTVYIEDLCYRLESWTA